MKNCVFDISATLRHAQQHASYSGIQRVVTALSAEFYDLLPEAERACVYVGVLDRSTKTYKCAPFSEIRDALCDPGKLASLRFKGVKPAHARRDPLPPLAKYRGRPLKYRFHVVRIQLLCLLRRDRALARYGLDRKTWKSLRSSSRDPGGRSVDLVGIWEVMKPGDRLVLLDATWHPSVVECFCQLRDRGLVVVSTLHDLIPLVRPEYCLGGTVRDFAAWLTRSMDYTSSYLAVSENTRRDLETFLRSQGRDVEVHTLPLAQGFGSRARPTADVAYPAISPDDYPLFHDGANLADHVRALGHAPYVLCVGTIEIRKNPLGLAQAWRLLLERSGGDLPKLVFAGRPGWLVEDFNLFLEATGNLYGYIQVIEEPSDEELAFLYRNCLFAMMPSFYEGWGLPVGEALSFGKTAVVSNCASLPEVGGKLVEYCDPSSVAGMADAAWRLISDPEWRAELERRIRTSQLRTWKDVAEDFREILGRM